ncbi:MAG: hypothetical protein IPK07_29440 [Deltaproteobacteria bacterium]|nr:hypothetical protein [Deltaproteobacteria bacterium]
MATAPKNVREQLLEEVKTDDAEAALDWMKSRWQLWAGIAGAALGAIVVYAIVVAILDRRDRAGQVEVAACVKALDGSSDDLETGIGACSAVIEGHGGSPAGKHASLAKGVLLVRAGKGGEAVTVLTELLDSSNDKDPLFGPIQLALARAQEAAGKPADAAVTYRKLRDQGFSLDEYTTLDLVRVLQASGKTDEARKLLEGELAKGAAAGPGGGSSTALYRARLALLDLPASGSSAEPVKN